MGAPPAAALALGWHDRVAAAVLLVLWSATLLLTRGVLLGEVTAWHWPLLVALTAHLLVPPAPYGSLDARGRLDPAGGWRITAWTWGGIWAVIALAHLAWGIAMARQETWRLGDALFVNGRGVDLPEMVARGLTWWLLGAWLLLAPLAALPTTRAAGWALAAGASVIVLPLAGHGAAALALLPVYLMTFDPCWVVSRGPRHDAAPLLHRVLRERPPAGAEVVFYDGNCGLCHHFVRFVLAEDAAGDRFVFAPLGGERFRELVPAPDRDALPDSVVVRRADGTLLVRSAATMHVLASLGGLWRVAAWVGAAAPRAVRDAAYDAIAAVRHRLFAPPVEACPLLPAELRGRFAA
ncbi:MAG: DCC1-like thiol-disulfide oxidoreductase family protein [Phycisphaeraceae bacterium]